MSWPASPSPAELAGAGAVAVAGAVASAVAELSRSRSRAVAGSWSCRRRRSCRRRSRSRSRKLSGLTFTLRWTLFFISDRNNLDHFKHNNFIDSARKSAVMRLACAVRSELRQASRTIPIVDTSSVLQIVFARRSYRQPQQRHPHLYCEPYSNDLLFSFCTPCCLNDLFCHPAADSDNAKRQGFVPFRLLASNPRTAGLLQGGVLGDCRSISFSRDSRNSFLLVAETACRSRQSVGCFPRATSQSSKKKARENNQRTVVKHVSAAVVA